MTKFGNIRPCRECGHEIQFLPVLGWVHVNVVHHLECEGE